MAPDRTRLAPETFSSAAGKPSAAAAAHVQELLYRPSSKSSLPDPIHIVQTADGEPTQRGPALEFYNNGRRWAPVRATLV